MIFNAKDFKALATRSKNTGIIKLSAHLSSSKLSSLCSYIGKPLPEYPQQTALHRAMGQVAVLQAISQGRDIEDPYLEDEADTSRYIFQSAQLAQDPPIDSRYNKFTKQALNALRIAQTEIYTGALPGGAPREDALGDEAGLEPGWEPLCTGCGSGEDGVDV